jgi:hypothetical protein
MKKILKAAIISSYVNAVDFLSPCKGALAEQGFFHWKQFFGPEEHDALKQLAQDLTSASDTSILLRHPFLGKILLDPEVNEMITSYLGSRARLDFVSGRVMQEGKPASPEWHHDSVGHRIKIFVCVNDQSPSACTEVIPGSHRKRYFDYNDSRIEPNGAGEDRLQKLIGRVGDLLVFDTNLLHRGIYDDSPRYLVQMEFSSSLKRFRGGHIGCRESVFPAELVEAPFVSRRNLKLTPEGSYSYPK